MGGTGLGIGVESKGLMNPSKENSHMFGQGSSLGRKILDGLFL